MKLHTYSHIKKIKKLEGHLVGRVSYAVHVLFILQVIKISFNSSVVILFMKLMRKLVH